MSESSYCVLWLWPEMCVCVWRFGSTCMCQQEGMWNFIIHLLKHATSLEAMICFISAICLQGLSLTLISLYFPTGSIKQIPSNQFPMRARSIEGGVHLYNVTTAVMWMENPIGFHQKSPVRHSLRLFAIYEPKLLSKTDNGKIQSKNDVSVKQSGGRCDICKNKGGWKILPFTKLPTS